MIDAIDVVLTLRLLAGMKSLPRVPQPCAPYLLAQSIGSRIAGAVVLGGLGLMPGIDLAGRVRIGCHSLQVLRVGVWLRHAWPCLHFMFGVST